jgi:hypothetical protein
MKASHADPDALDTPISMTDLQPKEPQQPEPIRYAFKPSAVGSPLMLELTGQGLSYTSGFRSDLWRYADIARIRLSYRPVSMLSHRFRADIWHSSGKRLRIISATWAGIVALTPQNDGYRAFIEELHRRLATESHDVQCVAGLPKITFVLACAVFAAVMAALASLLVRALVTGEFVASLFMVGFGAWFGWHTGGWLKRNTPRQYTPDSVPRQMLP